MHSDGVAMGHIRKRTRGLLVDARAGRSNKRKTPSTTADEAGTGVRHGARNGQ